MVKVTDPEPTTVAEPKDKFELFKEAREAARPLGPSQRCDNCRFWEVPYGPSEDEPDDREGHCHRRSPRATDDALSIIGENLEHIRWAIEVIANITRSEDFEYQRCQAGEDHKVQTWPMTAGSDWCGDFEPRPRAVL